VEQELLIIHENINSPCF